MMQLVPETFHGQLPYNAEGNRT